MEWIDIASIIFVCVTMNIINCPKCCTFWTTVLLYLWDVKSFCGMLSLLAISFLASYSAIWLELLEAYIDTLYMKLYEKICRTKDNTPAADANSGDTTGSVS